jgi:enediyne biosynthesis protein E4
VRPIRTSYWVRRLWALAALILGSAERGSAAPGPESQEPGFRWSALNVAPTGQVGFTLLAPQTTGLHFTNRLSELAGAENRVLYNGAGVAAGDVNRDGRPDLFFCDLSGHNALFLNLGDWRFREATVESGLATPMPASRGATFADVNGDGALDLLVSVNRRGVVVYLNDGRGHFSDQTASAGTTHDDGSTTLALADIDGNGTLDLYVANYRTEDMRDLGRVTVKMVRGQPVLAGSETSRLRMMNGRLEEAGQPDRLYLNDGSAHFGLVSWTNGTFADESGRPLTEAPMDWGLTATFRDVNGDLAPDLYVFNDYWTPDRFWINDGHGRFRAIGKQAVRKTPASSMSGDFADLDRDGRVDFLAVDMLARDPRMRKRQLYAQATPPTAPGVLDDRPQVVRNTLFRQNDDGTFSELAYYAGLSASDWSWSPLFLDVDLDGYEDLVIGAGHFRDVQDFDAGSQVQARQHTWEQFTDEAARRHAFTQELMEHYRLYPLLRMPIVTYRNRGDWTFEETTDRWGLNQPGVHQGLATADFDGDGDLDLAVNNLNAPASLYRNDNAAPRVAVQLRGRPGNTQGIGAKVSLESRSLPRQTTELICGGRYQSGSDPLAVFAIDRAETNATIEVRWRSGRRSRLEGVQANRRYEVDEAAATPAPTEPAKSPVPLFEDVSPRLAHRHQEEEFDDYARQPLLPFKLSQLGPGVAWTDLDGDGHDDLVIGTGRGGALAAFRGDGRGHFAVCGLQEALASPDDLGGLVAYPAGPGRTAVLAACKGYEESAAPAALAFRLEGDRMVPAASPGELGSGCAFALGDMQGDGRLALFVAGGVVPGQYPRGAPSRLYRWDRDRWVLDARNSPQFNGLGIVNAAIWTDLTGDGLPELVLACEWGSLHVFRNRGGLLFDVAGELGLSAYTGWWRGVTSADLDGDGRLDLVASNWGLNSAYRASPQQPLVLVYGQLGQPGVVDILETEYVQGVLVPRRQLATLAKSLPFLLEQFSTHAAYSEASLEQVLGERSRLASQVRATTLESAVFLNRGDRFVFVPLPKEAQLAPAFAVCAADFDGDGAQDVFLSQNFFDFNPEGTRIDAGRGLLLRGDGRGHLAALTSRESGIAVYGQQRAAAVGDFDEDGRVDLVVTQNGADTKLYHNVTGKPGLRVRLVGPPGNPWGIGAVLRLGCGSQEGPAHEILAGSGYWSQDSLTPVLHGPGPPDFVSVRWPGGRVTRTAVPRGSPAITIDSSGALVAETPLAPQSILSEPGSARIRFAQISLTTSGGCGN